MLRKRFGQHFLADENVLERIVNAFHPVDDQRVLEIGPGTGALTERLLARIRHLTAVELDRDLAAELAGKYDSDRLTIIRQDILNFDIASVFNCCRTTADVADPGADELKGANRGKAGKKAREKIRVIGNLPYNISTPLLFHLLKSMAHIQDMIFMLQKEVALRLSAVPGSKVYGRLSVMAALELECQCLFDVPPEAFDPPPRVESTVIRLTPNPAAHFTGDRNRLDAMVKLAFGQRRKTLRNALQSMISAQQFANAGIDATLRAENLSVEQFIRLSAE